MKTLALAILTLALIGCACNPAVKAGVANVDATQGIILPQYSAYVEADAKLTPEQKADRAKLVESLKRLMDALKEAVK
jgi:predicted lipoprotein